MNLNSIFIVMCQGQFSIPRVCVEAILCVVSTSGCDSACVCVCTCVCSLKVD